MTSLYAAGSTAMLKDSIMPRMRPANTAAVLLPRPPSMATVKPFMASPVPLSYWTYDIGQTTQPAKAPIPALIIT